MFSLEFQSQYPATAAALNRMVRGDPAVRSNGNANAIKAELVRRPPEEALLGALFESIWQEVKGSHIEFVARTAGAFAHLGVDDEVRTLMAGIWAAGMRGWDAAGQLDFLRALLIQQEIHRELALEFLPEIAGLGLAPSDLWAWILASREGRPTYSHRIYPVLQAYAERRPGDALQLVRMSMEAPADATNARLAALLISWVRGAIRGSIVLDTFEAEMATGTAEQRGILLESWAFSASSPALDESMAGRLKSTLLRGPNEIRAWCFLLQQVIVTSPDKWPWASWELGALIRPGLSADQRQLLLSAILEAWLNAKTQDPVPRSDWEALFRRLPPLASDELEIWRQIDTWLADAFRRDAGTGLALVNLIAETSGQNWAKLLQEHSGDFLWWCEGLRAQGQVEAVIAALCFSGRRSCRRVGLHVARRCGESHFNAATIAAATAPQIEMLLLELVLKPGEPDFVALMHLAFAGRIDQVGGPLAEWFYDEVLTQALNTHQYRQAISAGAPAGSRLREVVAEAEQRIDASAKAAESPALRMRVPGHARAELMGMRRFAREVAKGAEKYSIFAKLFPTVPLLYSKSWQMTDANGALGRASELKKTVVTTEMPRLEFMTPEAMRQRRLLAARRITELDGTLREDV